MLLEKCSPPVVEKSSVRLKVALDALTWLPVFLLERDHLLKELNAEQRWFAALP
jgi:hypothetical protein